MNHFNRPSSDKKKILMLFPGPRYHVGSLFQRRLEKLSAWFRGSLITISDEEVNTVYGDFSLLAHDEPKPRSWPATVRMFRLALVQVKQAKEAKDPFDLIVTYDPLKIGLMALLLSKISGVPYAVEVNGDFYAEGNYLDVNSKLKKFLVKRKLLATQWLVLSLSRGIKKLFSAQLSQATYLKNKLVQTYPDYIDLSIFNRKSSQDNKVILFVGFPYYLKGVDLLVDAFNIVNKEFPEWRLHILGWFQDMAPVDQALTTNPNIHYKRPVYFEEMPEVMSSADIFVLPSRTEAMGRVLLEAAAAGVARIGSNAGGIPEVVNHGVDGLIFESGDVISLTQALRRLMGDPDYRHELIANATNSLEGKFSEGQYLEHTRLFYESVIESA
ncbi:MAG: glycosyltransferase family 4 protein [Reinekea sp.]|nr:glycosyltransferase family 4 protein [Reinekea sp.]